MKEVDSDNKKSDSDKIKKVGKEIKKVDKKVTLRDIAGVTGLSVNTVCRVLQQKPYYTKDVEKRVKEAAAALGYVGDSVASALRLGTTKTIAIVYDDFVNPFFAIITSIIAKKLRRAGYEAMIFSNYGESPFLNDSLLRRMLSRKVDGIISFLEPEDGLDVAIKASKTNFIIVGRDGEKLGLDSIALDNVGGGRMAVQHLIDKGHRDIAYVGADRELSVDKLRLEGYKRALEENNIPFDEKKLVYLKDFGKLRLVFDHLINNIKSRAVFCFNDIFSLGLMEKLSSLGYRLPDDYALVGFDNVQASLGMPIILTSIGTDVVQLAEVSIEVLLLKMEQKDKYSNRIFNKFQEVKLIKGPTT